MTNEMLPQTPRLAQSPEQDAIVEERTVEEWFGTIDTENQNRFSELPPELSEKLLEYMPEVSRQLAADGTNARAILEAITESLQNKGRDLDRESLRDHSIGLRRRIGKVAMDFFGDVTPGVMQYRDSEDTLRAVKEFGVPLPPTHSDLTLYRGNPEQHGAKRKIGEDLAGNYFGELLRKVGVSDEDIPERSQQIMENIQGAALENWLIEPSVSRSYYVDSPYKDEESLRRVTSPDDIKEQMLAVFYGSGKADAYIGPATQRVFEDFLRVKDNIEKQDVVTPSDE